MAARLSPCSLCTTLGITQELAAIPDHLKLQQKGFARDPQSGSRLDRYSCTDCGTGWLVEVGANDGIVDWYEAE